MYEIQLASKKLPKCEDCDLDVITHKPYIQKKNIPVASAKQVFKNRTSIVQTCTRLSQNVCCVK